MNTSAATRLICAAAALLTSWTLLSSVESLGDPGPQAQQLAQLPVTNPR